MQYWRPSSFIEKKMKDELITVKYAKMGHSILEAF